jgi:hypothetical protein
MAKLSYLRGLSLAGTKITDAGLEALRGMASLQSLDVRRTAVTKVAADELESSSSIKVVR